MKLMTYSLRASTTQVSLEVLLKGSNKKLHCGTKVLVQSQGIIIVQVLEQEPGFLYTFLFCHAEISLTGLNDEHTLERESKGSPNNWTSSKGGGERERVGLLVSIKHIC